MKPNLLLCSALLFAATSVHAQFSLQPQVGVEQAKTSLNYGDGLSANAINSNLKAALKMSYNFKGNTPFISLTTAPASTNFVFDNSGALINSFQSGTPKLRIEGGYQFTSKAIQLGKQGTANTATPSATTASKTQGRCGMRSRCAGARMNKLAAQNQSLNMRLQPAIALAYVPSAVNSVAATSDGITYKTAAYKTALVPSMGFEFAKGRTALFSLNVFYTKPLMQGSTSALISSGIKAFNLPLQTTASSWGLTLGIPINLAKARAPKSFMREHHPCQRFSHSHCSRFQQI